MPDEPNFLCPGKDKCPYRINAKYSIALFCVMALTGTFWYLVTKYESRAPTIFEVAFAVTSIMALTTEPIHFFDILKGFLGINK